MIQTKFQFFIKKLVSETNDGNIVWESVTEDDSSYKAEFKDKILDDVVVQVSVINMGNVKEAVLKVTRGESEMNVNLAPKGGEIDKLIMKLFDSAYAKKLDSAISVLEDNGTEDEKSDIMGIFETRTQPKES